jgi:hypothetical protein
VLPSSQQTEKATQESSPPPSNSNQSTIPNSQISNVAAPAGSLPPQLHTFYSTLKSTLETSFAEKPPHTVQRLTELILRPNAHYRTLPAYLRALDRVISVSSTADVFPLPISALESNGTGSGTGLINHADDFNGAALTKIQWLRESNDRPTWLRDSADLMGVDERQTGANTDLRTESTSVIDGPNGAGSVETVTVAVGGGGRNLNAGVASSIHPNPSAAASVTDAPEPSPETNNDTVLASADEEVADEVPHARGPEEIGMEDMGPQSREDVVTIVGPAESLQAAEKAMGRPGEAERVGGTEDHPPSDKDVTGNDESDNMSIDEGDKKSEE